MRGEVEGDLRAAFAEPGGQFLVGPPEVRGVLGLEAVPGVRQETSLLGCLRGCAVRQVRVRYRRIVSGPKTATSRPAAMRTPPI
ncbi:hypothetical protein Nm8I071_31100 [Nonomuraea sp. TT08I-71]|nr:hypothetical protein Nm8I071_31100 [Nonomuraea sp. TT08I-71]